MVKAGKKDVMNTRKSKGKVSEKKTREPLHKRVGLIFPIGRISRLIKKGRFADRVSRCGPTFMAATLQYLIQEIVEVAYQACAEKRKKQISPQHL